MSSAKTGVAILTPQVPKELHHLMRLCAMSRGLSLKAWCLEAFARQVAHDGSTLTALGLPTLSGPPVQGEPTIRTPSRA